MSDARATGQRLVRGSSRRRRTAGLRFAIVQFAISCLALLAVVATIGVVAIRHAAHDEALRDAAELAGVVGDGVIQTGLTRDVIAGKPAALAELDASVQRLLLTGPIVRVKVWTRDGRIIYSDVPALVGRHFPVKPDLREAFASDRPRAEVSELEGAENVYERRLGRLVEVYLPLRAPDGARLVAETYQRVDRIEAARARILRRFLPVLLLVLVALALAQAPLAAWLTRRVRTYWRERDELAQAAHRATGLERRRIAHDLHDGVVQDLAGISYEFASLAKRLDEEDAANVRRALQRGAEVSRESAAALRTLLVDLYSSDRGESISAGLEALARPLRQRGIRVTVDAELEVEPEPSAEELLYRAAREAMRNVTQHAAATDVALRLRVDASGATLIVSDNGKGMAAVDLAERRAAGHVGLALLAERMNARGGRLSISSEPGAGTTMTVELPPDPAPDPPSRYSNQTSVASTT